MPLWFRRKRNLFFTLFAAALALGALSVRPFTQLLVPWVALNQWRRAAYPTENDTACIEKMQALGATFTLGGVPEPQRAKGCAIETPLVLTAAPLPFINIAFVPPITYTTLSCSFAIRLHAFVEGVLKPEAIRILGSEVKHFLHKGGYACRGQRSFTSLKSEHAFGEAMDFAGVELQDGRIITIERDYTADSDGGRFLRSIAAKACSEFGTSLGPPFNEAHRDHIHIAIGFPKRCVY